MSEDAAADNPALALAFIKSYPTGAARLLERVDADPERVNFGIDGAAGDNSRYR